MKGTASLIESGRLVGIASRTGIMDRGGDVITRGAFQKAIPGFLKTGFVPFGHRWDRPPAGMPEMAVETKDGLFVCIRLHQSEEGSTLRQIIQDRLNAGLEVGLSIGFLPAPAKTFGFRSGKALLSSPGGKGLDHPSIAAWPGPCRLITEVESLFEVSIVSVPMNPEARLIKADGRPDFQISHPCSF